MYTDVKTSLPKSVEMIRSTRYISAPGCTEFDEYCEIEDLCGPAERLEIATDPKLDTRRK